MILRQQFFGGLAGEEVEVALPPRRTIGFHAGRHGAHFGVIVRQWTMISVLMPGSRLRMFAQLPLYHIARGKDEHYACTEEERSLLIER